MKQSPNTDIRMQAEWAPHAACWLAWPCARDLWRENLPAAQTEFVQLCRAISGIDVPLAAPVELIHLLVPEAYEAEARGALSGIPVQYFRGDYGDIWVRDTGPIFVETAEGQRAARFAFNGWGGKYVLPHDSEVSQTIAGYASMPTLPHPWILEGGAIEVDGQGTCLTTRQCLLNDNRSPGLDERGAEQRLADGLGIRHTIWLDQGLLNDHTDGHIDTLARFVAPGKVVCMVPSDERDPNRRALLAIRDALTSAVDARGERLQVTDIPSPGELTDEDGKVLPASYMNFYISNRTVTVPTYGSPQDQAAVDAIARCFPTRKTIGLSARAILSGGGAFHCITQQQPVAASHKGD